MSNPRDYNAFLTRFLRGTREEVALARDEARLTELGPRVASDINYHDSLGRETAFWIVRLTQEARRTAAEHLARVKADKLPPVAPVVRLTAAETQALTRVLRQADRDLTRLWLGRGDEVGDVLGRATLLGEVANELLHRRGAAQTDAALATSRKRTAYVDRELKRFDRRQQQPTSTAARRVREGRARGQEGRDRER